jgi:hypothetical protein
MAYRARATQGWQHAAQGEATTSNKRCENRDGLDHHPSRKGRERSQGNRGPCGHAAFESVQSDPKFAGHSTIKIATKDQPAHVLLYKPEQESVLPYLVAYQCEFALRTIQADPNKQFNLSSRPNMLSDVLGLMDKHHKGKDDIPSHVIPQLANRLVMVLDSNSDPCQSRCVSTN